MASRESETSYKERVTRRIRVLKDKIELIIKDGKVVGVSGKEGRFLLGGKVSDLDKWLAYLYEMEPSLRNDEGIEGLMHKYSSFLYFEYLPMVSDDNVEMSILKIIPRSISHHSFMENFIHVISSVDKWEKKEIFRNVRMLASRGIDFYGFEIWEMDGDSLHLAYLSVGNKEIDSPHIRDIKIKKVAFKDLLDKLSSNELLYYPSAEAIINSPLRLYEKNLPIQTLLIVPITMNATLQGFIRVLSRRKDAYSTKEQSYIKTIAQLVFIGKKIKDGVEAHIKDLYMDPLTHVYNMWGFREEIIPQLEKRKAMRLACIYVDLDNFKSVNDVFGHQVGDDVLKSFAEILKKNVRHNDYVIRKGGDEFILLLSNVSRQTASDIIERVRREYKEYTKERAYPDLRGESKKLAEVGLDVSYGIREISWNDIKDKQEWIEELNQALNEADKEMYSVKTLKKKEKAHLSILSSATASPYQYQSAQSHPSSGDL